MHAEIAHQPELIPFLKKPCFSGNCELDRKTVWPVKHR